MTFVSLAQRVCLSVVVGAALGPVAAAQCDAPLFDVPRLDKITVDGRADDWAERGFRVEALAPVNGGLSPASDFAGSFRLGWNERGLLVLVTVRDDVASEGKNKGELWQKDSVELFVGTKRGVRDWMQTLIGPGIDPQTPELRYHFDDHRESAALKATAPAVTAARTKTANGYIVEALLPWDLLKIRPETGREAAFQIVVNDVDADQPRVQQMWYPEDGAYSDPGKMHRIRLAEKPGSAVRAAALADLSGFPRTRVRVIAPGDSAGKAVEVRGNGQTLAKGTLSEQEGWAGAALSLPMPPRGQSLPPLAVLVAGREVTGLSLPDFKTQTRAAFERARLIFAPFVFTGTAFPAVEFEHPALVEDLIGPYALKTVFYDGDYQPVTTAAKPGRYGAITEIRTEDGQTFKRFHTLFRQPEQVNWWQREVPFTVEFPQELGIDPAVVREQKAAVSEFFRDTFFQSFSERPEAAMFLAGLYELKPGSGAVARNSAPETDRRWWFGLKQRTGDARPYPYLSYTPKAYATDRTKRWPLLVFLHGSGERGNDLALVRTHGPAKMAAAGKDFPFVIVAPQCPPGEWWLPAQVNALVDEVSARYRIDPDRIYLTGLSMGGFGTWNTALQFPERFAAIAPICGGGDPADAARLKNLPAWVFHGAKDTLVPLQLSEEMVEAVKKAGGDVQFTVYPEAGHDSWTESYNNPKLYDWFLRQRRSEQAK